MPIVEVWEKKKIPNCNVEVIYFKDACTILSHVIPLCEASVALFFETVLHYLPVRRSVSGLFVFC